MSDSVLLGPLAEWAECLKALYAAHDAVRSIYRCGITIDTDLPAGFDEIAEAVGNYLYPDDCPAPFERLAAFKPTVGPVHRCPTVRDGTAGKRIQTEAGPAVFWGSDCVRCGNTTDGSMTCDECGSLAFTVALWEMAGNRQAIERRSEARDVALSVDADPPDAVASLSELSPPTQNRAPLPIGPLPKSGIAYQHDLNAREPATQHKHFGYQHGHDRGSVFHDHYGGWTAPGAVLPEYEWLGEPEFWWHRHGRLAHPHEAGSVPHTHERMA